MKSLFFNVLVFISLSASVLQADEIDFTQLKLHKDPITQQWSFDKVASLNNQKISIKGFLYKTQQNEWLLAPHPLIKTCCTQKKGNMDQRILLTSIPSTYKTNQAVHITGTLSILQKNHQDSPIYKLSNIYAKDSLHQTNITPCILFPLLLVLPMIFYIRRSFLNKKS